MILSYIGEDIPWTRTNIPLLILATNTLVKAGILLRLVLLGITGISWYGRNYGCISLVSKVSLPLADSDCLLDYLKAQL